MNFYQNIILCANGLFDFDLTFLAEILLFSFLSFVITTVFLNPISAQLADRADFVNYNSKKAIIFLTIGFEKLDTTIDLITKEIKELTRQLKIVKDFTNEKFDNEIFLAQKESLNVLSKLKGELSIKSAFLFSSLLSDISLTVEKFFQKKFLQI